MWPTHYLPRISKPSEPAVRTYLTTPPYPVELLEEISYERGDPTHGTTGVDYNEQVQPTGIPVNGILNDILLRYTHPPEDDVTLTGIPLGGTIVDILIRYTAPPEDFVQPTGVPLSGTVVDILIRYDNWLLGLDLEDVQMTGVPLGGVLT